MKHLLFAAALAATAPVHAADVGVSLSIGQPGFYGQIDIGDFPQPQVIYAQPRYIYRQAAHRAPIYLRVPPGHAKNWRRHCREYNACHERVYFVRDDWYSREYVHRYQERHNDQRADRRDERRDDRRDGRGNDRHDNGRGHGPNR
ncbi:MAG: hypothetical protein B7Y41_00400 [Hydrogenophilales bacterium 28-61-23]|nr:MAG: hypothetical protein B7Y41_00400 [Hydrogenophilales bacterium 28-61-23]